MESSGIRLLSAVWSVFGLIGIIVLLSAVASFLAFRFLSVKWLDAKFAERLEAYKHVQQLEIENLRFRISNMMDRTSKIHVKEYEYLPNIWESLNEAYRSTQYLTGGFRQYPNLSFATAKELQIFLDSSDLADWEKDKIRDSEDKTRCYMDFLTKREFGNSVDDHAKLRLNLDKYAIFFSEEIKSDLEEFADMLWNTIVEFEIYVLDKIQGAPIEQKAREELRKNGRAKLKDLERKVRDRLWDAGTASL